MPFFLMSIKITFSISKIKSNRNFFLITKFNEIGNKYSQNMKLQRKTQLLNFYHKTILRNQLLYFTKHCS